MKHALVWLAVGCGSTAKAPAPVSEPPQEPAKPAVDGVKLRGTITEATFDCPSDGRCEITIQTDKGPRDVEINAGYIVGGPKTEWGQAWDLGDFIIGKRDDAVGQEVEVYGADKYMVTLQGSRDYYVRLAKPPWPVPDGWGREQIQFPLEFSPELKHRGMEELRFAPGFLKDSPNRWSYAFQWDLRDEADLDANALATELTLYFRGLLVSVDGDKKRFDPNAIKATAEKRGDSFVVKAHVFDSFGDARAIDLEGTAKRTACGEHRVVWRFVMAPASSPVRKQLDSLAAQPPCA